MGTIGEFLTWSSLQGWVPPTVVSQLMQPKFLHYTAPGFDPGEDGQHRTIQERRIEYRVAVPGYEWLSDGVMWSVKLSQFGRVSRPDCCLAACRRRGPQAATRRVSGAGGDDGFGAYDFVESMIVSGPATCSSRAPGPLARPGLRPLDLRSDFGAGFLRIPSLDGGLERLCELAASCRSNSAIRSA
ncbi:hypothetical protein OG390_38165 [Streptomyces sp. NBC_00996]|nr:hypothetical protein OG390_38165 [Streptomyces sp. NBC_00996]